MEVVGAFAAAKSVLPIMIKRGSGSIFFSSATAAYRGSSTHPLYAIGKFGLRALSQSLTKEYAKNGVHIVHVRLDCDLDVPYMKESYGVNYNSENLTVSFNARYLLDIASQLEDKNLTMNLDKKFQIKPYL